MKTRLIKTLVKKDHKLGKDMLVLGRILGAMAVICMEDPVNGIEYGRGLCADGYIIASNTTDEKYERFANVIESWYAGLCVFDYVE